MLIKLDRPQLRDLLNHIIPEVSPKWYDLGIELNIDDNKLEEIKHDNCDDSRTCCHIGGGTRGALGASAPTKFISAHRNLDFHNRNVSC